MHQRRSIDRYGIRFKTETESESGEREKQKQYRECIARRSVTYPNTNTHTHTHSTKWQSTLEKANGHSDNSYIFMRVLLVLMVTVMVVVLCCLDCMPCYSNCFYYAIQCHSIFFLLFFIFIHFFSLSLSLASSFDCITKAHSIPCLYSMLTPDLQPC